ASRKGARGKEARPEPGKAGGSKAMQGASGGDLAGGFNPERLLLFSAALPSQLHGCSAAAPGPHATNHRSLPDPPCWVNRAGLSRLSRTAPRLRLRISVETLID